jgi:putative mRNA 3-end processing factor
MEFPEPLVTVNEKESWGLYCPAGDFHIDPVEPVPVAVITHAHADHLRHGSARYILARPGEGIARHRLGGDHAITAIEYGERLQLGSATISLHPAGHILGSSQVRIEHEGRVWVVSGDYKRQADPTCAAYEPLACDAFISEATFALPVYRWPATVQVVEEIFRWWRANRERGLASVLFCYALGKAQRVLAELRAFTDETVFVHGSVDSLVGVYRRAGVAMLPARPVGNERRDYRGALILAPPAAAGTPWMRRFGEHATGFCSGWMRLRGERRRRGYDRGFVLSDHADWEGLTGTCLATGARQVLLTHGYSDALARYLREQGLAASVLKSGQTGAED